MNIRPAVRIDLNPPLPASVLEAREEIRESLEVASFADEITASFPNAANCEKLKKGIGLLRSLAAQLQEACDYFEQDPFDESRLRRVEELREKLKQAKATILAYASSIGAEEVEVGGSDATPEEKEAIQAMETMDEIMASLGNLLDGIWDLKGEEFVAAAQVIAAKVKAVTSIMRNKAQNLQGKDKERMFGLAKVLNDSSIQAKILAAVLAAEKGHDMSKATSKSNDSFSECAKVLMKDMGVAKNLMEETTLRASSDIRMARMRKILEILRNMQPGNGK